MKNLNIRKKIMMLAMVNTFVLAGNSVYSYAASEEAIDITEFEDIRDIVVAQDEEVAIRDIPDTSSNLLGVLKPGEYLKLIADTEGYYEVLYRGKLRYINKEKVYVTTMDDFKSNIDAKDIITAIEKVDIKQEPTNDSETIGSIKEKESLKVNEQKDGYYEVVYKDGIGYVESNKVEYKKIFKKSGYTINDCGIYDTTALENKTGDIAKEEFIKIYDETDNAYYVETNGINGYINKDNINLFYDKYIVVDISDQIVEMYDNNELLLSSSVVTGRPQKNSTPTGVYYIGDQKGEVTDHRYLVGEGYKSYVDYMMKFTGNIGFHDSEYGVDDRGVHHGWRNASEYGGTTYLTDGSHGCVNMPNDAAKEMYDIVKPHVVDQGNIVKVLVKE